MSRYIFKFSLVMAVLALTILAFVTWPTFRPSAQAPALRHPLDPLTGEEINSTVSVLKEAGKIAAEARFVTIHLKEPLKDQVISDVRLGRARRSAFALIYNWTTRVTSEAVVDLDERRLASWKDLEPDDPPIRAAIINRAQEVVKSDQRWQKAARDRGITDFSRVTILPQLVEREKLQNRNGDRFAAVFCFLRDVASAVPIMSGLDIEVNLTKGTLTRFEDGGSGPAGPTTKPAGLELRPLQTVQPNGPSFQLQGSEVRWQHWRFRYGVHPRRGLEIYDVAWEDGRRLRSILYRASISEMIAPYGDPSFVSWYPQDEGDYGLASYSRNSAVPLDDAPPNAVFESSFIADDRGNPLETPRAVAIYERDGGLLWRHGSQARRARTLVLTAYATIDNYDYAFNWVFGQDGAIEVEVLLTGMMNVRNVRERTDEQPTHLGHPMFGHLVAAKVNAPNHQHFFSFRLDFDIDGARNSVLELNTQSVPPGKENPKGEAFSMTETVLDTEQSAKRMLNLDTSRKWKVANTRVTNALGQVSGYVLVPGENSIAYAAPNSAPRLKAGFINAHLWVTPYSPDEMFASGDYVNFNVNGEGLPKWTSANRRIDDRDVVVWYTLGITHVPRTEDWPIMPAHSTGFRLIPAGFFSQNPAMDVRASGN